ncbi:hypothetical protein BDA96_01G146000 [Sorghum bicolor]|uniref:Uncharacterized protein n=2 Tax=Sorghum bicolor TaxID=4558 RepID=A0A921S0G7_SORBI|nr:hypothetical protein BDA96_01G146000 [Sorghum bicolor]KAG0548197.1 hypothetical protein BDA96_01G146000 [Sorghum bicolor]OQU91207.1 hypothetical protein SORBI_3001G139750 [Sorghum bicolor]
MPHSLQSSLARGGEPPPLCPASARSAARRTAAFPFPSSPCRHFRRRTPVKRFRRPWPGDNPIAAPATRSLSPGARRRRILPVVDSRS